MLAPEMLVITLTLVFRFRGVIEDGIYSDDNNIECRIPDLPLNSPEMMAFLKEEPKLQCDENEPWVVCGQKVRISKMDSRNFYLNVPLL